MAQSVAMRELCSRVAQSVAMRELWSRVARSVAMVLKERMINTV